jgi:branched-chain amino acid transport system substrate-binding protein
MAQVSEPIIDRGGMAMISPANSNPVLTSPVARHIYEPLFANGTIKYPTYYRVVTTDNLQGPAGALYMAKTLHIKTFYYVDDGQTYGVGLAQHMAAFNKSAHLGMKQVGSGRVNTASASAIATTSSAIAQRVASTNPQAVYCGCDEPNSYSLERDARRDGWKGTYVGGDAIFDSSWFKFVGNTQALNTTATFVGLNPAFTSKSFRQRYHQMFPGFVQGPYDALSYDAASIALNAIFQAKKAGKLKGNITHMREAILPYVRNAHWMGANGLITFDANGDTFNRVLSIFKTVLTGGKGDWKYVETYRGLPSYLKPTP